MTTTYTKLSAKSLKGCLLIEIRKEHIINIVNGFIDNDIISLEYIDNNIRLNRIAKKQQIIINRDTRIKFLINLFNKECVKGTAKIISDICK